MGRHRRLAGGAFAVFHAVTGAAPTSPRLAYVDLGTTVTATNRTLPNTRGVTRVLGSPAA